MDGRHRRAETDVITACALAVSSGQATNFEALNYEPSMYGMPNHSMYNAVVRIHCHSSGKGRQLYHTSFIRIILLRWHRPSHERRSAMAGKKGRAPATQGAEEEGVRAFVRLIDAVTACVCTPAARTLYVTVQYPQHDFRKPPQTGRRHPSRSTIRYLVQCSCSDLMTVVSKPYRLFATATTRCGGA